MSLIASFSRLSLVNTLLTRAVLTQTISVRHTNTKDKIVHKAKPGATQLWRKVHYPEDKQNGYTVKPLETTHLAGRDPKTGRKIHEGIGGGVKHKMHWIKWHRDGPSGENEFKTEKVIQVFKDGNRTAHVALVASGDEMKYILATVNMKAGDLLKTSKFIPRIPVRANEGDAHPLGALPSGTQIHCIEKYPGENFHYIHAAGTYATIVRKYDDRVVVQFPKKREYAFDQRCMATVGRLSNVEHGKTHIGSAWQLRWLGYRPRSGLWQRKGGRHGRKIKPIKPMRIVQQSVRSTDKYVKL